MMQINVPKFMDQLTLLSIFCVDKTEKNGVPQIGLFTKINFNKNELLFKLQGKVVEKPTKYSVQIYKNKHIQDRHVGYMNHHCFPNTKLINLSMIAIKDIKAGEELTFDYNVTEDLLAFPFICSCCGKEIGGSHFKNETLRNKNL